MITVSLCMIVKNEEKNLPVCLESLKGLVDEMIIADTGSSDKTKDIAESFGAKVYDFKWNGSFSDARNFVFDKASCDYIYSADADEEISEADRRKFMILKKCIEPEIDIVQMQYTNQLAFSNVYNFDKELRPKLFKRLRKFIWLDQIHEQVRLTPLVYDSDIEIIHRPSANHAGRDLASFRKLTVNQMENGESLSSRLFSMYARELMLAGTDEDFMLAKDYFMKEAFSDTRSVEEIKQASCIVVHAARISGDMLLFMKYALKEVSADASSEMCCEIGEYYYQTKDYEEAILWFYNAVYETKSSMDIRTNGEIPLGRLADCYHGLGDELHEAAYRKEADNAIKQRKCQNNQSEPEANRKCQNNQ